MVPARLTASRTRREPEWPATEAAQGGPDLGRVERYVEVAGGIDQAAQMSVKQPEPRVGRPAQRLDQVERGTAARQHLGLEKRFVVLTGAGGVVGDPTSRAIGR